MKLMISGGLDQRKEAKGLFDVGPIYDKIVIIFFLTTTNNNHNDHNDH